jgi:uncharacterized protein (UPF0216 family)
MDREELEEMLKTAPTLIRMNDDREYVVDNPELFMLSSMALHLLRRSDDGKLRAVILPLVTMACAEQIELSEG